LLSNHIYSIFIDREGVAWFGTDRGVCRYDPHALRVEAISADTESNFVRALVRSSDGTLWCGTNRGLFARNDSGWKDVPELKGKVVHSIAGDPNGRLLVGTASGLFEGQKLSTGRRKGNFESTEGRAFVRIENAPGTADKIRAISVFQGAVYIANFGRGVERLDGSRRTLVWPDESTAGAREREVVSLHAESNWLWIGTAESGVFRLDGKQATADHAFDELIGAAVWSMEGSLDDVLWLASARGLYALKSGKLRRVVGDVDARCVVAASEQAVWCATNGGGLYKVLLDEGAAGSFLTARIDTEQGMPTQDAFAVLRETQDDEALWIGTSRGIARYDPGREPPLLDITRVIGRRVYSAEELRAGLDLEYPQNSLAIEVRAISSRTFPEQFQYSFSVMDSQDRVISEKRTSESQLLIENLRPGHYRVAARAFTNDLVASDRVQFSFVVARAPFPWTSSALAVLLGLALVAMWWGYRQNRKLFGANRQLADTRMQLANETETERRRIARDLHDQTLADLRRLMLLTDRLPAGESTNGYAKPSDFRDEIEAISTEIRRICEDLSPSALANVGLGAALEWALTDAVAHQPPESRFEYEFVCELGSGETSLGVETQIQIYRIVQEAISNICRHAGASRVSLRLMIDVSGDLVIELEDNGCGFDRHNLAKAGRGLNNMRSRASLIDAQLEWSTKPQRGTRFILRKTLTDSQPVNA
jgi:signal transduction histidine kinase